MKSYTARALLTAAKNPKITQAMLPAMKYTRFIAYSPSVMRTMVIVIPPKNGTNGSTYDSGWIVEKQNAFDVKYMNVSIPMKQPIPAKKKNGLSIGLELIFCFSAQSLQEIAP